MIQPSVQVGQKIFIVRSKVTGDNLKTFVYTAIGHVHKLGSSKITPIKF
jgi:hypothetical protein